MPRFMTFAALAALMLAVPLHVAEAQRTPTPTTKLAPASTGQSKAQPGDTCLGASACNTLIVECVQSGHDFKPMESGPNGEPTYGQCVKRTD